MTASPELYACLYAKEFPAQALLRMRPDLRNKPCVVMEGEPPLQQVCSLNARAHALGMAQGMTKVEVDTFSAVHILRRSLEEEVAARAALLECTGTFSPRVEDRSGGSAFLCVLDITGTERLFGPPAALAEQLLDRARALGITACVAVSNNFHASVALAQGMPSQTAVQVVPPGEERRALSSLPLAVLELTEEQSETFSLWGIKNLGMLADLPEKQLIARMGQAARGLRQLARGEMPHLFQPVEPAFALAERMELDTPIELLDSLLFGVSVMLDQLILRAMARSLGLAAVTLSLRLEGGLTHTRTVRLALPATDKQLWIKLFHLDLQAHPPQAAILALTLTAEPGSISQVQLGMFSPQLPEPLRLDVTLARIRAIVGEENVGRAVLRDTQEPDGFRLEPFGVSSSRSSGASAMCPAQSRAAVRQLRPAEAVSITMQDERPKAFVFRECRYTVERAYGPWLSAGEWWNPALWAGEQWDLIARAHNGVLLCCCAVRDLAHDDWQLVALYD